MHSILKIEGQDSKPISFVLVVMKAQTILKTHREIATASLVDASDISMIVTAAAVFIRAGDILTSKEQRTTVKAFLGSQQVSTLPPTGLDKSFVQHHGALQLNTEW